jgi:hypothetical protein
MAMIPLKLKGLFKEKSTFRSPVYNVRAIPLEKIRANSYNPNSVAPPEMKLLEKSIWEDGYTMPIVWLPYTARRYLRNSGRIPPLYRDAYK